LAGAKGTGWCSSMKRELTRHSLPFTPTLPEAIGRARRVCVGDGGPAGKPPGARMPFPVSLPRGEYVMEISARAPEGDAAYYFRVVVV
jgi:hypothetical protein